ncbi:hypothetical protein [Acidithiobacillus caldus]|uniref:Uncharacterized protein n=1 Tax=Acidithiobacillus caldus (strain ATCC 51756 / DSM 8584 / KU) TaxID=637389 RepID=A0A059ZTH8_ACICK|nr:hypothetical protein [Acidithiobacillus caldus]AIA54748.1 hypothetical protein Acaty_c0871 [Acidithiobacillus caldus ATCC 51756]MBU2731095.1 hypothetical protein [Acidithiobacillus caldus]MBU2735078.1 hypothetical protein [Acidithiobacillus caldus ATCC 51756]MBU2746441.1 hypothetical protein [Acidithiobacillus caldus]MBU2779979.1 hypothetical protein [Acidithiobacillus caldus]
MPRRSGSLVLYLGLGLLLLALFLMVLRYLGVVFATSAKAQLALQADNAEALVLLHLAQILNWVRWRWIADILAAGVLLTLWDSLQGLRSRLWPPRQD